MKPFATHGEFHINTRRVSLASKTMEVFYVLFLQCTMFLADKCTSLILGTLVTLFWITSDFPSGLQSQIGFCLIRMVEANAMYIPRDPAQVLHL